MTKFSYTAKDKDARMVSGTIEAKDDFSVAKELKNKGLTVISVAEQKEEKRPGAKFGRKKVKAMDLVVFSRQLATLIDSGISLVAGLLILREQVSNPYLSKVVANLKNDIEAGNSLSASFAKYPDVFPEIFTDMIRAGEYSGSLNEILERLADYLERVENVRRKLKSSLSYPVVVVGMAAVIVAFLMLKVVPTFKNIFEGLGSALPLPTLILIKVSSLSIRLFPLIVLVFIIFYVIFIRYIRTEKGRLKFDQFKLKLPVLGVIFMNVAISRFTRTLATLIRSGVGVLEAFEISGKVSGNKVIELATDEIRANLATGESISGPMAQTGKFPVFVVKMIGVGEQTGELEKMLTKVSDYFEEQINETLASLTSMLEPVIIVFLGIVIGSIVLAMFLPIFKLSQALGH